MPRKPATPREAALRALVRREHSAAELKSKLARRGHTGTEADEAIERLAQSGLQSDERYTEVMVRSRIAQGFGPLRIEAELAQAGVAGEQVGIALAAAEPDWRALAVALHARKFKAIPKGAAEWQKQYRFLAGRGFEPDHIRAALKGEPAE